MTTTTAPVTRWRCLGFSCQLTGCSFTCSTPERLLFCGALIAPMSVSVTRCQSCVNERQSFSLEAFDYHSDGKFFQIPVAARIRWSTWLNRMSKLPAKEIFSPKIIFFLDSPVAMETWKIKFPWTHSPNESGDKRLSRRPMSEHPKRSASSMIRSLKQIDSINEETSSNI